MLIAVINNSKIINNNDVELMVSAVQKQVNLHVCPAWGWTTHKIVFYANPASAPGYAWKMVITDNPDVDGVLGYHEQDPNGKIIGFVFVKPVLDNGGVVLYDETKPQTTSVSSVLSHEIIELIGDKYTTTWVTGEPINHCFLYALELCDPVENFSYSITVNNNGVDYKVSVSDFVFPSYFNMKAKNPENAPFDYLKELTKPFSLAHGGYCIVSDGKNVKQIFAAGVSDQKKALKASNNYRRFNRRT